MSTLAAPQTLDPFRRRRRRSGPPAWAIWAGLGVVVAVIAAVMWLRGPTIVERDREARTVKVVLPPPPPPPPPPEPKPQEDIPEPKPTPIEQPQEDTPPPPTPTPQSEPTVGDSALTAREGAGPTSYGLAKGDGGGTRIGGRPGGGGDGDVGAYVNAILSDIRRATQADPELARGRYAARMMVRIGNDGRISGLRLMESSGNEKRDRALERRLVGLQLSVRPLPGRSELRIELNSRSGA